VKVRYLQRAVADLIRIEAHIRAESPRGAARVGARIRKRAGDLAQFPFQGTRSRRHGVFQLYVAKTPYILIYRLENDEVQIITVVHTSQRRRT
jgi:toxin ParE1/3/4